MFDLAPLFAVTGIAVATIGIEYVLDRIGHGDKKPFVAVIGYGLTAYYAFRVWMDYARRITAMFGIFI